MPAKQYRIKQFSKLTSVTVRSLQYYDDIGLLKPSGRTESGHRLYSEADMLKLQQITTLKFMGFTLSQIKDLLSQSNFTLAQSLEAQSQMLLTETDRLKKAVRLTRQATRMLKTEKHIDWKIIAKIIEVLQMKEIDAKTWAEKYFTPEERKQFQAVGQIFTPKKIEDYQSRWRVLFAEVEQHLDSDPSSEMGQRLVKKWIALVEEAYGDYPEIRKKLWEAFKAGSAPKEMTYFDQRVIDYIDKAAASLKKQQKT